MSLVRDSICCYSDRREPDQKIGIRNLASRELSEFIAGESDDKEKQSQEDRRRRCIVADQPDADKGSPDCPNYPHDRFNRDRTHIRYAHHHQHSENSPAGVFEAQDLCTIQGEQTRQTKLDPVSNSEITDSVL